MNGFMLKKIGPNHKKLKNLLNFAMLEKNDLIRLTQIFFNGSIYKSKFIKLDCFKIGFWVQANIQYPTYPMVIIYMAIIYYEYNLNSSTKLKSSLVNPVL